MSLFAQFWIMILQQLSNAVSILWNFYVQMLSAVLSMVVGKKNSARRVVGIFSREAEESYRLLYETLQFQDSLVREVRTSTITNNAWHKFSEDVSRCDFAILYHSKNRGRVNITNVKDSLYDEELKHLSKTLGKENVLVVIDDLDSTTPADKQSILSNQTLIKEKARDLVLFSKDKNKYKEENIKKLKEMLSYIGKTTQPIIINKGSRNRGMAYLNKED